MSSCRYSKVEVSEYVKILGVTFDNRITLQKHITNICGSVNIHIRKINSIRRYLSNTAVRTLVQSIVIAEALHGSHVFCLSSHVRWRCVRAQRENTKRILLLFSYGNIICRHLQICFFLDYTT